MAVLRFTRSLAIFSVLALLFATCALSQDAVTENAGNAEIQKATQPEPEGHAGHDHGHDHPDLHNVEVHRGLDGQIHVHKVKGNEV